MQTRLQPREKMVQFDQSLNRQPIIRSSEMSTVNNNRRIGLADEGLGICYAKSASIIKIFETKEASFTGEHPNFWLLFFPSCSLSPAIRSSPANKHSNQIRLLHVEVRERARQKSVFRDQNDN